MVCKQRTSGSHKLRQQYQPKQGQLWIRVPGVKNRLLLNILPHSSASNLRSRLALTTPSPSLAVQQTDLSAIYRAHLHMLMHLQRGCQ